MDRPTVEKNMKVKMEFVQRGIKQIFDNKNKAKIE